MYAAGRGITKNDVDAASWYRKAAEQHNAAAEFDLGLMYTKGQGVAKDDAEAVKWFRKAADQGFALAQNNLGLMYVNGRGVPRDKVQAHKWLNLASAINTKSAVMRDNLAKMMTPAQIAEAQKLARDWKPPRTAAIKFVGSDRRFETCARRMSAIER